MQTHTHINILNQLNYLYILQEFLLGDTLEKNLKVHNLGVLDKNIWVLPVSGRDCFS